MKAEEIMASISLTLGVPIDKISDAIQIALNEHLNAGHVCKICRKPISYNNEYEYWHNYYKNVEDGRFYLTESQIEKRANSDAKNFRMRRVRCSRCSELVWHASYHCKNADQFFNALSITGATLNNENYAIKPKGKHEKENRIHNALPFSS